MFALMLLVLSGTLHLLGIIEVAAFEVILAITTVLGLLAVFLAGLAYVRIWHTGGLGWGRASLGFLSGLLALGPLGYVLAFVVVYPSTADITTDALDPPELALRPDDHQPVSLEAPQLVSAFPDIVTRTYDIAPEQLYALVEGLVGIRDWSLVRRIGPVGNEGRGTLNVLETTPFGWENELAFRIAPVAGRARLDLRAAPVRDSYHDLGHNGRTIDAFLSDLDDVVTIFERDATLVFEDAESAPAEIED